MISIRGYGCQSSAGAGVKGFWNGLVEGKDHSQPVTAGKLALRAYRFPNADKDRLAGETLTRELLQAWHEAQSQFVSPLSGRLGIIYASAKGSLEDFIWHPNEAQLARDPLAPVLEQFTTCAELHPTRRLSISNACASSVAALWTADRWLNSHAVDYVIVLAADFVGPFVLQGFHSLKSLSEAKLQPFGATRDGLRLGEAAAVLVLSRALPADGFTQIASIGLDTNGYAVTRPRPESLDRAIGLAMGDTKITPDLIVAHGTGTQSNDETEDSVFALRFARERPPITATKWSIGHTLGASGAMDVIAACEIILRQKTFAIGNTEQICPKLRANYLIRNSELPTHPLRNVLVSSLGFGGLHSALLLRGNA